MKCELHERSVNYKSYSIWCWHCSTLLHIKRCYRPPTVYAGRKINDTTQKLGTWNSGLCCYFFRVVYLAAGTSFVEHVWSTYEDYNGTCVLCTKGTTYYREYRAVKNISWDSFRLHYPRCLSCLTTFDLPIKTSRSADVKATTSTRSDEKHLSLVTCCMCASGCFVS